jgi:hypothetical protein
MDVSHGCEVPHLLYSRIQSPILTWYNERTNQASINRHIVTRYSHVIHTLFTRYSHTPLIRMDVWTWDVSFDHLVLFGKRDGVSLLCPG